MDSQSSMILSNSNNSFIGFHKFFNKLFLIFDPLADRKLLNMHSGTLLVNLYDSPYFICVLLLLFLYFSNKSLKPGVNLWKFLIIL